MAELDKAAGQTGDKLEWKDRRRRIARQEVVRKGEIAEVEDQIEI
jgi:hypothetical protein